MLPTSNTHIQNLFEEYLKKRGVKLSKEEFCYIILLFPSLLVCMSDGKLDAEEWNSILSAAESLALEFSDDNLGESDKDDLSQVLRIEFRYLLDNISRWTNKFQNALKHHLAEAPEDKEFIYETIHLFANSADGISDIEQATIDELINKLSLQY